MVGWYVSIRQELSLNSLANAVFLGRRCFQTISHRRPHTQGRGVDGEVPLPSGRGWQLPFVTAEL